MKKVLIVATVVKKHIMQFHIPTLKMFKEMGWETHVAGGNDYAIPSDCRIPHCDVYHEIDFARFPFHPKNIKAYKELKGVIDTNKFDVVHCHTPVGSVLARLGARNARKKGTKVFYTAHGFHFFKGAPLSNWLLYYPVEKLCSYLTDCLITINDEDYQRAVKKFHAVKTELIPGVGVDTKKIMQAQGCGIRKDIGAKAGDILLLSVGEVRALKNHRTIIDAMARLKNKRVHYVIAGEGDITEELKDRADKLGVGENVHFTGYRKDIYDIIKECDIFCFPSLREGLSVAVMEAMAGSLPVVASRIRGNTDLICEGKGGFLYHPDDSEGFAAGLEQLIENKALRLSMGAYNAEKITGYDVTMVCEKLRDIYAESGVLL